MSYLSIITQTNEIRMEMTDDLSQTRGKVSVSENYNHIPH